MQTISRWMLVQKSLRIDKDTQLRVVQGKELLMLVLDMVETVVEVMVPHEALMALIHNRWI